MLIFIDDLNVYIVSLCIVNLSKCKLPFKRYTGFMTWVHRTNCLCKIKVVRFVFDWLLWVFCMCLVVEVLHCLLVFLVFPPPPPPYMHCELEIEVVCKVGYTPGLFLVSTPSACMLADLTHFSGHCQLLSLYRQSNFV